MIIVTLPDDQAKTSEPGIPGESQFITTTSKKLFSIFIRKFVHEYIP